MNGVSWGPDIVHTFGPLGYLYLPRAFSGEIVALSIVYLALVYSSFFAVAIWQLRHRYGAYVAVAGSFVLFCLLRLDAPEATTMTAVLVGASFLAGEFSPRIERWIPLLFGAAAAIQLLVKSNTGLLIAVMGLWISLVRPERWRAMFVPERRPGLVPITKALFVGYFFNNVLLARGRGRARGRAAPGDGRFGGRDDRHSRD